MILHPAVIALVAGSFLVSLMILYASFFGLQIVRAWDLKSGSEKQSGLEKRTYLISTLLAYAFGFEILSFFLFIYTVDDLHRLFVGAMCGAGTLNANAYGYPTVLVKGLVFILAGLWLILNHADNQGRDYPLIRVKYSFLLVLAPLMLGEASLQGAYFLNLKADVITSCCGSLFSTEQDGIGSPLSMIAGLNATRLRIVFYGVALVTVSLGMLFYRGIESLGIVFSAASLVFFLVAATSLISFICLYYYELPTHHCPFCILQGDYFHVGYLLYSTLLGGVISGAGVGILAPFRRIPSLLVSLPGFQRKLAALSVILDLVFSAAVSWQMIHTDFILQ
jgi:hypothetical protein